MDIILFIFAIIVSCLIIWRASDGFDVASEYIGRNLKDGVRGATINAIGSSMPELFTTMWFLFVLSNEDGFAGGIGTTAGSAIFNSMIIPAVVILAVIGYGLAKRVTVSKKVILRDGISLIAAEVILIFVISGTNLDWYHGLILMLVYLVYVVIMLKTMTVQTAEENEQVEEESRHDNETFVASEKSQFKALLTLDLETVFIRKPIHSYSAWLLLIITMLVMGGACALLVHSCEGLGEGLGIQTYFVAVILASAATSVPDTILSYRDAMDGKYDDAVANALGSNIFDVCFALGFPLFLFTVINGPITMSLDTVDNITELRIILLLLTVLAFVIYIYGKSMGKIKAVFLLLLYALFTVFIASKAYGLEWAIEVGNFLRTLLPS